jgi:hypothetical protein
MSHRAPFIYRGKHRRRRPLLAIIAATLSALFVIGCAGGSTPDGPVEPNPPAARGTTAKGKPAGPATVGDGQHAVGADIKAGTYTTTVPEDALIGCYWARVKDFEGELKSITANGNLEPGAKGRVVVKKSDAGVELKGGCEWKRSGK